jgi:hypothetical protein
MLPPLQFLMTEKLMISTTISKHVCATLTSNESARASRRYDSEVCQSTHHWQGIHRGLFPSVH